MITRLLLLLTALAFAVSAQCAAPTCGLTIITPGFQLAGVAGSKELPPWVKLMAQAITNRIGVALPIYHVRYDKSGNKAVIEDGPTLDSIAITNSGGGIIMLNWTEVSTETSDYHAQDVADYFFARIFDQQHNGHYLAGDPNSPDWA